MITFLPGIGTADSQGMQKSRAPVQQPALKQAPAPQTRSAQGDCVRAANQRGFTVLDTSNFQQMRDGWSIDLRVRNQRGQMTNGSCFVESRTSEVTLYGFGWGYDDDGDDQMRFNCASVDMKHRECQLPVNGRAILVKRLSDSRCIEGQSWGQRRDRVWVDNGCRAKFEVTRSGGGGGSGGSNGNGSAGSGGSGAARAEQACLTEAQRRGWRILQQSPVTNHTNGYKMQMKVRMPSNDTRLAGCFYSLQTQQARLDIVTGL